jgi:hypothetical protein
VSRDPQFEADFLDHAAHRAGLGAMGFQRQVLARLDAVESDEFLRFSLARFAREIGEEGHDVAGWAVGAAQCDELAAMGEDDRAQVMEALLRLAALGVRVEWQVRQLRSMLD